MSQPTVTLHTPSSVTVELVAHRIGTMKYSATLSINNTKIARVYAHQEHELDENTLILNGTYIPLLPESVERVKAFFKEAAQYKKDARNGH